MEPHREWLGYYHRYRRSFDHEEADQLGHVDNSDGLQRLLNRLSPPIPHDADKDQERASSNGVAALERLDLFAHAVTTASEDSNVARPLWDGLVAIIQSAERAAWRPSRILALLTELHKVLPAMRDHIDILPGPCHIQWPLQDLYCTFVEHCLDIVQYLRCRLSWNPIQRWWSVTPHARLRKTATEFSAAFVRFERDAKRLNKTTVMAENLSRAQKQNGIAAAQPIEKATKQLPEPDIVRITADLPVAAFTARAQLLEDMMKFCKTQYDEDAREVPSLEEGARLDVEVAPKCCVLYGASGIGKTQTAYKYAYQCRNKYDLVLTLPANNREALQSAIDRYLVQLKVFNSPGLKEMGGAEALRKWLESTERSWLLIFDNVGDLTIPASCHPFSCRSLGTVIMTTRDTEAYVNPKGYIKMEVEPLKMTDGAQLLFKCLDRAPADSRDSEYKAAEQISELFEGNPRAITAISNFIKSGKTSVQNFIPGLKRLEGEWMASAFRPLGEDKNPSGPDIDLAKAIKGLSKRARSLLNILAFMDTKCIPTDIFRSHINNSSSRLKLHFCKDNHEFLEDMQALVGSQLAQKSCSKEDIEYLSLDRTLQRIILLNISIDPGDRERCLMDAIALLESSCVIKSSLDVPDPENWPEFEKYSTQFLSVLDNCLWPAPALQPPQNFADLLSRLSTYLWHAGKIEQGRIVLKSVVDAYDCVGIDGQDSMWSDVYSRFGNLLGFNGISDRQESLDYRERAHAIRQSAFDNARGRVSLEEEMRLFNVKSDLAFSNLHQENFAAVESTMEECLRQYKIWNEDEKAIPFEYSKYYFLMSFVHMSKGLKDIAEEHARRSVELMESAAGVTHPMTQLWKFGFGTILYHANKVEESWLVHEEVRQIRIRMLGQENHSTLESYSMCGALLTELGRLDEAEGMLNRCLERVTQHGWYDEGTARARFRLYKIFKERDKADEAAALIKQARDVRQHILRLHTNVINDSDDEELVFDQMVSLWAGRLTGKLKHGQIQTEPQA